MIQRSIFKKLNKYFSRAKITQESFIQTDSPIKPTLDHLQVNKINKQEDRRKLENQAIPCSPLLGPVTIQNPIVGSKLYRWCSCGMSQQQPFCDKSHLGTAFKPIKFTIQEVTKQIDLCGCKLSKEAPFCDKNTCKKIIEK